MSTRGARITPTVAGLIAGAVIFAIVGVMAWINVNFAAPWTATHTLTVETSDADGITASSDVRINGRLVGQVTGVAARGRVAEVTVHVDGGVWPLPATTKASVRLGTLLGSKYIELEPPAATAGGSTLADGGTIHGAQPVVDFDQILDTFDAPTRTALRDFLATGGKAFTNQEGTLQNLLPDLADLNQHSQAPTGVLAARNASLDSILGNLAITADQLAASRNDLAGVIDNLNRVTTVLAQNQGALRAFVSQGDRLLIATDSVLGGGEAARLATAVPRVDQIVHDLDDLMAQAYPQSASFQQYAAASALNLVYEVGDATSMSDRDGYWLRQNLQGLDLSNFGIGSPTGASTGPPKPNGQSAATAPKNPVLPPITIPLPPIKPICVLSICVGGGGSSGAGGAPSPSPTCILGLICTTGTTAPDGSTATPAATLTSDGAAGSQASNGEPAYASATFALWGGG